MTGTRMVTQRQCTPLLAWQDDAFTVGSTTKPKWETTRGIILRCSAERSVGVPVFFQWVPHGNMWARIFRKRVRRRRSSCRKAAYRVDLHSDGLGPTPNKDFRVYQEQKERKIASASILMYSSTAKACTSHRAVAAWLRL